MAEKELKDPVFVQVKDIKPGKHCYNVYAKIVKITESERIGKGGEKVKVLEGTVADETSSAKFKFVGEHTKLIAQDAVIAIRNGRSSVVNEHIVLELDKFGKVTLENDHKIEKPETEKNISDQKYERKARAQRTN